MSHRISATLLLSPVLMMLVGLGSVASAQCTTQWLSAVSGDWNDAARWSAGVPEASDRACIHTGGTYTVTVNVNASLASISVGGGSGLQTLEVPGGRTLAVADSSDVGENAALVLAGTLSKAQTMSVAGSFTWTSGDMDGQGPLVIAGETVLSGTGSKSLREGTLRNEGTMTWTGGALYVYAGAEIDNRGTFLVDAISTVYVYQATGPWTLRNSGTLRRTVAGQVTIDVHVENSGTIDAQAGTIRLTRTGEHTDANVVVAQDAEIRLEGTQTISGTLSGSPSGRVVSVGVLAAGQNGGTVNLLGTGMEKESGNMDVAGGLTNTGNFAFTSTASVSLREGVFRNEGTVDWDEGALYIYAGATLDNDGTFVADAVNTVYAYSAEGPWRFVNSGTLRKTSEGTTTLDIELENTGKVEVMQGALRLTRKTVNQATSLDVRAGATLLFHGGTHVFDGTITGAPAGDIQVTGGTIRTEEGRSATFNFGGTGIQWLSGNMDAFGTLINAGIMSVSGSGNKSLREGTLRNEGTMAWTEGALYIYAEAEIDNRDTFVVDAINTVYAYQATGPWTLRNSGTLRRTVAGQVRIDVHVENSGTIDAQAGTIRLTRTGEHTDANVAVAQDAEIRIEGTQTISGTLSGSPSGRVVSVGVLAAGQNGGTVNLLGTGMDKESGNMDVAGGLTNTGNFAFTSTASVSLREGVFRNEGTVDWDEGALYIYAGATLDNDGTFVADAVNTVYAYSAEGPWRFVNSGTLRKTSEGLTTLGIQLENTGDLEVMQGTMRLSGSSDHAVVTPVIASAATLELSGGAHVLRGTTFDVPAGATLHLSSGTLMIDGTTSFTPAGVVKQTGGTLAAGEAGGTINIGGSGFLWEGGSLGSGSTTLTNAGTILMGGAPTKMVTSGVFQNEGTMRWLAGGFFVSPDAVVENTGAFEILVDEYDAFPSNAGTFRNSGVLDRPSGDGDVVFRPAVENLDGGLLRVATGTLSFVRPLSNLDGAEIRGDGTISATGFSNEGHIRPGMEGAGVLSFSGNIVSTESATLEIELGGKQAGTGYDQLAISGSTTFNGTLDVRLIDGFTPGTGDEFDIVTTTNWGGSGGFTERLGLVNQALGVALYPSIHANGLSLTAAALQELGGEITVDPGEIVGDRPREVTVIGSGFAPDVSVTLVCVECEDPTNHGTVTGAVGSLSPTQAVVTFDLSDGRTIGAYDLVVTDPRGGEARASIEVTEGPPVITVDVLQNASEAGRVPGLFVVRSTRPLRSERFMPFDLGGTAKLYSDYMTDVLGSTLHFPAGNDSIVVSIFPLNDELAESSETVYLSIDEGGDVAMSKADDAAWISATLTIEDGPPSTAFAVFGSSPNSGGALGPITVTIVGQGFDTGTTVRLAGEANLDPTTVTVNESGTAIEAVFDLAGQPLGSRDIVVSGADVATLSGAFTVEEAIYPDVYLQVVAPARVPRTRERIYTIVMRNRGNVDVVGYPYLAGLPEDAEWELEIDGPWNGPSWQDIAPKLQTEDGQIVAMPMVNLRGGETREISLKVVVPTPRTMSLVAAWVYK